MVRKDVIVTDGIICQNVREYRKIISSTLDIRELKNYPPPDGLINAPVMRCSGILRGCNCDEALAGPWGQVDLRSH